MTPQVGVVLVTHNSDEFLQDTLTSMAEQTRPSDALLAVDDHSSDNTTDLLEAAGFGIQQATSVSKDITTRIAHNFLQGVRWAQSAGVDIVILGDHDDVWHTSRISHQLQVLEDFPSAAMVASNGYLIDRHGVAIAGTLRDSFPVPADFDEWSARKKWTYAIRHSLATGGASALRLSRRSDWSIPPGWLHDRWWSLRTLKEEALVVDPTPVIDYRVSGRQRVGLDKGHQDSRREWLLAKFRKSNQTLRRAKNLGELM